MPAVQPAGSTGPRVLGPPRARCDGIAASGPAVAPGPGFTAGRLSKVADLDNIFVFYNKDLRHIIVVFF